MKTPSVVLLAAIAVAVILVIYMAKQSNIAERLSGAGWVLYTREGCPYCTQQLSVFGGKYPKVVTYDEKGQFVGAVGVDPATVKKTSDGIEGFPLWVNTKTLAKVTGFQTEDALKKLL